MFCNVELELILLSVILILKLEMTPEFKNKTNIEIFGF